MPQDMICTRCDGTGFLNLEQVDEEILARFNEEGDPQVILDWIDEREAAMIRAGGCSCHISPPCHFCLLQHDVAPCDCCGTGEPWGWYYMPGLHNWDNPDDPKGCR